VAALIFIFFGLSGLYDLLPGSLLYPIFIFSGLGLLGFLIYEAFWGREKRGASQAPVCEPGEDSKILSPVEGMGKTKPEAGK
jgi:hypothetical protein